jgi:saccharopine dehydrogenase (NAD+, L-lysine-forming)
MIYGATGYTGRLAAQLAVRRGDRPVLSGRNAEAVAALATELGLPHRAVSLDDAAGLRSALGDVAAVAHCAGPFDRTSEPMVRACLDTGTHYLDITGEIEVFEAVFTRDAEARAAGVVLLPGAGFDVVPTDCLASRLYAALPSATTLELAFLAGGGMSPGTTKSALRGLAGGNLRRVDGRLVPTPLGQPRRMVPFPSGDREVGAIRWGDLSTAHRSTGIGTITVYTRVPRPRGFGEAVLRGLTRFGPTRALADRMVTRGVSGPDDGRRARSGSEVWGEVRDPAGESRQATLTGPNGYDLTADALLRAVSYVMAGRGPAGPIEPGAHTPSTALGADFVRELDGVTLGEVRA